MDYQKIYNMIIERRKQSPLEGYVEKHHILPRCLGGDNKKENIVKLSAREHYMCHLLLTKLYEKNDPRYYKMVRAFMMMCWYHNEDLQKRYFVSSKKYERLRKTFSETMSESQKGKSNSNYGTMWIYNLDLEISKKISKEDGIPQGWLKGKVQNFKKFKLKTEISFEKQCKLKKEEEEKVLKYTEWCKIYLEYGFREFCKKTGYYKSQQYLSTLFRKHIKEFVPQHNSDEKETLKIKKTEKYQEWYILYDTYGFEKFCEMVGYKHSMGNLINRFKEYVPSFVPKPGIKRGQDIIWADSVNG